MTFDRLVRVRLLNGRHTDHVEFHYRQWTIVVDTRKIAHFEPPQRKRKSTTNGKRMLHKTMTSKRWAICYILVVLIHSVCKYKLSETWKRHCRYQQKNALLIAFTFDDILTSDAKSKFHVPLTQVGDATWEVHLVSWFVKVGKLDWNCFIVVSDIVLQKEHWSQYFDTVFFLLSLNDKIFFDLLLRSVT